MHFQESVSITIGAAAEGNLEPYFPQAINVMPGSTVSWTNEDSTEHTVTADGGNGVPLFDSCPVPPGMLWESTFDSVGTFGYHCLIHPGMRGSIMVG